MKISEAAKDLRQEVVRVIKILDNENIFELSTGHVSARIPGTEYICILGHLHETGRNFKDVIVDDIVIMDMEGNLVEGNNTPPGERFLHCAIYKKRKDVQAIVHAHPTKSTVFGIAGKEILPICTRGCLFYPSVPIFDYAGQIDTFEIADKMADKLGDGLAVLLRGHGMVAVGGSLREACVNAINLEFIAEMQLMASTLGTPKVIKKEEYGEDGFIKGIEKEEFYFSTWSYYDARCPK